MELNSMVPYRYDTNTSKPAGFRRNPYVLTSDESCWVLDTHAVPDVGLGALWASGDSIDSIGILSSPYELCWSLPNNPDNIGGIFWILVESDFGFYFFLNRSQPKDPQKNSEDRFCLEYVSIFLEKRIRFETAKNNHFEVVSTDFQNLWTLGS